MLKHNEGVEEHDMSSCSSQIFFNYEKGSLDWKLEEKKDISC